MKKIKALIIGLLTLTCSLSVFACAETSTTENPSVEPSEPPTTTQTTPYDDEGRNDAIIDKQTYNWSDSEGLLNGTFSDGATVKEYAAFTQEALGREDVSAYYTNGEEQPNITMRSGVDLLGDSGVDESIREGVKGSHDNDKTAVGLAEENFLQVENESKKTAFLSIKPQCSASDFLEADYLSFQACIYNPSTGTNATNTVTLYFKNIAIMRLYRCTWYDIKIPLTVWQNTADGSVYENKQALYSSLMGEETAQDKSKGVAFKLVASGADGTTSNDYTLYLSDIRLGVESTREDLGRNFTNLLESESFNGTERLTNTFIYWGETEKVRRMDESGVNKNVAKYKFSSYDGGNIAVVPQKRLEQIEKYDYIYVTMYIETENPYPIEIGINGAYNVNTKKASKVYSQIEQYRTLVSANKWITYKIPIKDVVKYLYAGLTENRVFTAANVTYTYYHNALPLFYINGEMIRSVDAEQKQETYGFNVYISRIFLTKTE